MAQTSFALLTNLGRAKEAAALASGTPIQITHIAIGDGTTVPSGGETALYHEVARKPVTGYGTVAGAANVAYFDIYLAAAEGPYTIREAGLYDSVGDMIAIARYDPPINKPIPSSGQTVEGTIRLEVAFSDVANVIIVVDTSMQVPLQRLTRLPWIPVLSMTETVPPPGALVGDTYLIPAGATGAWTGQAGKIAEKVLAGWAIITPPAGHGVSLPDGRVFEQVGGLYIPKLALDMQSGKWSWATAGGTGNAITVALDPAPLDYTPGLTLRMRVTADNTGAVTINVNGLGNRNILTQAGSPLTAGDLKNGDVATVICYGAHFKIASLTRADIGGLIKSQKVVFWRASQSNTNVPNNVGTLITGFDAITSQLVDTTYSSGVWTIGATDAGKWLIWGAAQGSANTRVQTAISVNGGSTSIGDSGAAANAILSASNLNIIELAAGNTIQLRLYQTNSGAAAQVLPGALMAIRIGT